MDTQSQAKMTELLQRDAESLSREELEFVMARRSYLSAEDKKRFAKEIELHEEGKLFVDELPVAEMNLKQLKAKAKELGLEVKTGAKVEDVRKLVEEALADAE